MKDLNKGRKEGRKEGRKFKEGRSKKMQEDEGGEGRKEGRKEDEERKMKEGS